MSAWETSPSFFQIGEYVFALAVESELGMVQHCVNPLFQAAKNENRAICDSRLELTHIAIMSREPVTLCMMCVGTLQKGVEELSLRCHDGQHFYAQGASSCYCGNTGTADNVRG